MVLAPETSPVDDAPAEPGPERRWRRWPILLLLVVGGALVFLVMRPAEPRLAADPAGITAPDFTLPLLDGSGDLTLSSLRGKPVMLNFWASWCGPCKEEAPFLADGWRRWKSTGVVFLGVDARDSRKWARKFEEKYGIEYPSVVDTQGTWMGRYGVSGFPETFFIDAKGVIQAKWTGPMDRETIDQKLGELTGRQPDPAQAADETTP